ncbi:MAG: dihydropteroate synthase [Planctomycetia bacterium]|nr:dihydropteroate synthase [Planctomycetia bacterium]
MIRQHIHFVTGRLAEPMLRRVVAPLAESAGFDYSIGVMGITVAALMTTDWLGPRLKIPQDATKLLIPGYCRGPVEGLSEKTGLPVERGPKDLRDLPEFFGKKQRSDYGAFDIEILAEINHALQLSLDEILRQAEALKRDGADVIDVGCNPGETWSGVGECVKALRDAGHRVSIDSFNPAEIEAAAGAGAELVLSVNSTNRDAARGWGCEVVAVPDKIGTLEGLQETLDVLDAAGVKARIDPVLEPIGFGFATSLRRYLESRRRWPDREMMMGIGNLTELTDCDSAAINVVLLGFCQELSIKSVLTTQVIPWARTSVRECDLARRLVHYAVACRSLPKHVEPRLVMLRDPRPHRPTPEELGELAGRIKDNNYRVFVAADGLHLVSSGMDLAGSDPFDLFEELLSRQPRNLDASHAFYLGYELAKAVTAMTLGKDYRQDEALDWGFLTRGETPHREKP